MKFEVNPEKKDKFYRGVRGLSPAGIQKRDRTFKGAANIFLIVGVVSAVSRGVWAYQGGGSLSMILVSAFLSFVTWGAFALVLRTLAKIARLRSAAILREESLELDGDILTYTRRTEGIPAPQIFRVNLMETTACQDKTFHSVMFTGGVENSTEEPVDKLCDLEIVDYFEPSLTEALLDRGLVLHDWDNENDPACAREEQHGL